MINLGDRVQHTEGRYRGVVVAITRHTAGPEPALTVWDGIRLINDEESLWRPISVYNDEADNTGKNTAETGEGDDLPDGYTDRVAEELVVEWNKMSADLDIPGARHLKGARRQSLTQRITDPDWRDHWKEALWLIPERPFCLGSKGWRATLTWFLRPNSVNNLLEGAYTDGTPGEYHEDGSKFDE